MEEKLLVAVVSVVATATITYFGTVLKMRKDLEAKYDISLRDQRITVYAELWKCLQPLAKYSRPEPVTYEKVENLSKDLRKWYFEVGGLFLSETTRDRYFDLQEAIKCWRQGRSSIG